MGLKVSTTCELTFGGDPSPAVGTLVGGVHDGIGQMFMVIEHARMMVGTKAIATLSTGYLNALDFAKNRVQGADLTRQTDKTAPRVTIIHHPDVRRMLMLQKAYAEGMRALVLYTATQQDAVQVAAAAATPGRGRGGAQRPAAARRQGASAPSGRTRCSTLSLQTLGGSGFLQDYPIEQYIRDAKIDTLYEGTTGDPGPGLLLPQDRPGPGRRAPGAARRDHRVRPAATNAATARTAQDRARGARRGRRAGRGDADSDDRLRDRLAGAARKRSTRSASSSVRLLLAFGDLIIGWLLARQAEVAERALDNADGRAPPPTATSTRASSPRPGSSPRRCCPAWSPTARSSRKPPST